MTRWNIKIPSAWHKGSKLQNQHISALYKVVYKVCFVSCPIYLWWILDLGCGSRTYCWEIFTFNGLVATLTGPYTPLLYAFQVLYYQRNTIIFSNLEASLQFWANFKNYFYKINWVVHMNKTYSMNKGYFIQIITEWWYIRNDW